MEGGLTQRQDFSVARYQKSGGRNATRVCRATQLLVGGRTHCLAVMSYKPSYTFLTKKIVLEWEVSGKPPK
jgi:hypothetical protein